jgi:hypothetical protein
VANINVLDHLPSLTHYGPLQPKVLHARLPFEPWGELPQAERWLRDTSWMQRLNVGWVLLCEQRWPAPVDAELITTTADGFRLYRYPHTRGSAFLDDPTRPGAVRYVEMSPSSFVTRIDTWRPDIDSARDPDRPAKRRVVVSRLALPGWRAHANGEPLAVHATEDGLLAVETAGGNSARIVWSYRPPGLLAGAAISGLSVAALVYFALTRQRSRRRPSNNQK